MKANKLLKTLAASTMSLALLAGVTVMPAMAANLKEGFGPITFKTVLNMDNATGASVPTVTFDYTIAPGTAVPASETTTGVLAGVQAGDIVIDDAVFAPTDGTTTTTKDVTIDFSGVNFDTVGIYRYEITATKSADADITMDTDNTRTMDVYVTNKDGGGLEISQVVLMKDAVNVNKDGTYVGGTASKSEGFTNAYTTYQLTLDKDVTGLMGDKSREFDFTINFTGGTSGETMTYGAQTIRFDEDGNATVQKIKLADATTAATITGIPSGVSYSVVENIAQTDGYTTTATVQKGDGEPAPADVTSAAQTQTVATQTMGLQNNAVVVTNDRDIDDTPATGIIMNVAPYALMVVIAVAGVAVFMRKRVED